MTMCCLVATRTDPASARAEDYLQRMFYLDHKPKYK